MHLLDVNVWVAIDLRAHVHHASATGWLRQHGHESLRFCRLTQQGFLRIVTNPTPRGAGGQAITMTEAWQHYDLFLQNPNILFEDEPVGVEALWRNHTQSSTFSPKVWNDAYLAAFAKLRDYHLVTFDQGFQNYPGLKLTLLP